ncbi:MAG: Fe/S biogenesis protein NfuA [Euryarchaeota archaeon]|nr:Fe/S biogenesis protein NfuA [Euryarchaeota archaeon]
MIEITTKAKEMLSQFKENSEIEGQVSLKIEIIGRSSKGFQYDLQLIDQEDAEEDDIKLDVENFSILLDSRSAPYLEGTTLDYKETLMGGGFSFDNPNPLWLDDLSIAVAEVIEDQVNPVVATHGGHVDLVGIDDGKALIAFGGGCQGCGMVDVTLKQGVEVMITDNVPGVSEVVDVTNHEEGTNPFY